MTTRQSPSELTIRDVLAQVDRRLTRIEDDQRSMSNKFDEFREEVKGQIGELRREMSANSDGLRQEMSAGLRELRRETNAGFGELRREMNTRFYWLIGLFIAGWGSMLSMMAALFFKLKLP